MLNNLPDQNFYNALGTELRKQGGSVIEKLLPSQDRLSSDDEFIAPKKLRLTTNPIPTKVQRIPALQSLHRITKPKKTNTNKRSYTVHDPLTNEIVKRRVPKGSTAAREEYLNR